ncbi:energy-coupling factor ABC transporter ATP-binding protein [Pseudobacteroides cellulosolvens]|uniref:Sulfate-transporting ATPase n=1 Tax=Pseudobacteroides cellulosolvens ATCC 35603 = DSM 2933 TaxID=398512 RepID=A0A0L6JIA6_9FIRM|nr:ATP-binding cassette domain-containing protein [Pseudobacteroides cellulosolvens]KNY25591.1 Sulfate-transporting ATPase [Pseudobacteroides cellulosolvens ATCC 35603 = DSM 2933]
MIRINNLSYRYKNGNQVLKNLNINIKSGEFTAIIGQNGAGKTTLLKNLNGLLKPTHGNISICGLDTSKTKTSVLAKKIGFLFQNPDHQIFCSTVFNEIAFGLKNIGISHGEIENLVYNAAMKVGLEQYLKHDPFSLSKGQRQRVALASVLAMETDILVLDEPTTGQDYSEGLEIMEIVKELHKKGKTIVMVTHDMELVAQYANRVIVLMKGTVLEDGSTEEVLSKEESLALSNLKPPQAYLLARKFHKQGFFKDTYTVEDMFDEIISYLRGEQNACND